MFNKLKLDNFKDFDTDKSSIFGQMDLITNNKESTNIPRLNFDESVKLTKKEIEIVINKSNQIANEIGNEYDLRSKIEFRNSVKDVD